MQKYGEKTGWKGVAFSLASWDVTKIHSVYTQTLAQIFEYITFETLKTDMEKDITKIDKEEAARKKGNR